LKYKPGWSAEQIAAADGKVASLNQAAQNGELVLTPVQRSGTSAASRYRSAGNSVPPGADVDHVIDLQLGGLDDVVNMSPLNASVNRSLGAQIACQLSGMPAGTVVRSVSIC
jgi:filamentous hemagglutinin